MGRDLGMEQMACANNIYIYMAGRKACGRCQLQGFSTYAGLGR